MKFKILNEEIVGHSTYIFSTPYSLWDWLREKKFDVRILYDKRIDMYFACNSFGHTHYDMIIDVYDNTNKYNSQEDFINEIGTIENYFEWGLGGQFLNNGEEVEQYLYFIMFCPDNNWEELKGDNYENPIKTNIGTFVTRNSDITETNLYTEKIKKNLVENYIGSEFNGIVYHGSQNNNLKFKDNYPLYMTDDKELAQDFARGYVFGYNLSKEDIPTLYKVKLTLKNPYIIKNEDEYENLMDITNYNNVVPDMMKNDYDGFIYHDTDEDFTYYTAFDPKNQVEMISKELVEDLLIEKIVKIGNKWQVQSEKGRNMGTYNTKAKAEDRLRQVHYFKYANEDLSKLIITEENIKDVIKDIIDKYSSDDIINICKLKVIDDFNKYTGSFFITETGKIIRLMSIHADACFRLFTELLKHNNIEVEYKINERDCGYYILNYFILERNWCALNNDYNYTGTSSYVNLPGTLTFDQKVGIEEFIYACTEIKKSIDINYKGLSRGTYDFIDYTPKNIMRLIQQLY